MYFLVIIISMQILFIDGRNSRYDYISLLWYFLCFLELSVLFKLLKFPVYVYYIFIHLNIPIPTVCSSDKLFNLPVPRLLIGKMRTVAHQAPPSMGFSRQEYWSWLPFPSPGDLPNPGIEPGSPALQADTLSSEPPGKPQ